MLEALYSLFYSAKFIIFICLKFKVIFELKHVWILTDQQA